MHIEYYHGGSFARFNPGALRTANIANAFALAGHTVHIITGDRDEKPIVGSEAVFALHEGVNVSAGGPVLAGNWTDRIPRRIDPLARFLGETSGADLMVISGLTPDTFRKVRARSSTQRIPFVAEVDEWMAPADFSMRSWVTMFPVRYEFLMRRLPALVPSALSISKTMRDHLTSKGARVLVVPPLHASMKSVGRRPETPSADDAVMRLLLPGVRRTGFGKDRLSLKLVRDALEVAPELRTRLSVDVVGGVEGKEAREIASQLGALVHLTDHGRVGWEEARSVVQQADWLVALRDPSQRRFRFAFPSKVTEALVLGTPVIANDYSDIRHLLQQRDYGILIEDLSAESVAAGLRAAIARQTFRRSVVVRAEAEFTPAAMSVSLDEFARGVVEEFGERNRR